ncbi:MAG: methionyl-tRNA formyltransferase [Rhodoferax sp.]|uniref:methionyl-tRNA formyltransferase n=1 Tax=Rhodoferax sp. TaxID=50421 RepID=UPI001B629B1E|nr:methionyl-tRNA formyltransferase [Rhodoferax sp.]MBP9734066.1 methionyl-tRNA formyltransferase [Rhodoferax sp.]
MKLAFAGTPEFARVALAALHSAGHSIHLVLTQPDRPAGRGLKLQASPVKQFALQHGIPVAQPRSLRLDGKYPDDARMAQAVLQEGSLDAMVVAAYGLILPQWVLDLPLSGCFNIHASSLPRWRGAAPIHRAIEAGDSSTGVTIMQMDAGLDTGDMVLAQTLPILPTDTTGSLHDKLADLGATLMVQTLSQLQAGKLQRLPQPAVGICYASKIDKLEASIDWNQTAEVVARRVRAFNPNPVAQTSLNGEPLKIWAAHAAEVTSAALPECGTILAVAHTGIEVAAIGSVLILTELQRPGGKRLPVADFLRGFDIKHGMRLV